MQYIQIDWRRFFWIYPKFFLHILETHHLTQRKASSILQYSSPNQLQRITKKEVSDKLMMDFGERLLIHREELDLTPDEIVSIRQCLFFPSMKKPDYNYAACLFATLCTSVPVSQTKELHIQSVSGSQIHHFHQHLSNAAAFISKSLVRYVVYAGYA